MRYLKFNLTRPGEYLGSAAIMQQAIDAAKGYAAIYGVPITVTGLRDDGQARSVVYHPDGRIERIWALAESHPFTPVAGETYRNAGGGKYRCRWASGTVAGMVNVKSGWEFTAHGCRQYFDGSIEWAYSTEGCFTRVPV